MAEELNTDRIQQATFVDERVVTEESSFIAPPIQNLAFGASDSMASTHISALDVFKVPLLLSTVSWTTSQPPSTILTSFAFPFVFESSATLSTIYAMLLQLYAYFKFEASIRVVINATKFHSGKLIISYDPVQSMDAADKEKNIYSASCLPNIIIDAADSNSGVIDIPFEHILSYFSTNSTEPAPQMGTVNVMVLNQLGAADSTPSSIQVNTFVYCRTVGLEVPVRPHAITFTNVNQPFLTEGIMSVLSSAANMAGSSPSAGGGKFSNLVTKGVSGIQGAGSAIKGTFDNLATGNFSGALSSVGDGIKSLLGVFNLDKPALPNVKVGNMLAPVAPLAHMKGEDSSVRLASTNQGGYLETDFSAAPPEELNVLAICSRPTLADQITWPASATENTQLFRVPVHPGYCTFSPVAGKTPAAFKLFPTYLAYMSTFYDQWKGSINFRFDFAASQFHTGRLQFAFEPNSNLTPLVPPANTVQDFSNSPELIFDLHEDKSVEINIPYVSTTIRKFSRSGPYVQNLANANDADLYMLGYLYIRVLTPLVAPNNVAPDITFNVYVSAGSDFSLHVPRVPIDLMTSDLESSWPNTPLLTEGGTDVTTRTESSGDGHSIIKGMNKISLSDPYNEACLDVRDLTRRYGLVCTGGIPLEINQIGSNLTNTYPRYEAVLSSFAELNSTIDPPLPILIPRDFLYLMSRMYAFWSGSLRFKFVPSISKFTPLRATVSYVISEPEYILTAPSPFDINSGSLTGFPTHTTLCSQDDALEFETPFYSAYQQLINKAVSSSAATVRSVRNGPFVIHLTTTNVDQLPEDNFTPPRKVVDFDLYKAAGDDLMFRFLVSPPAILRSNVDVF